MSEEKQRPLRVFLSYASQDRPAVRELYHRLKAEGWIDPWLDVENLTFGQYWTTVIEEALDAADVVIIFLSKNSVQKEGFIQRELNYAWELSLEKPRNVIFIIPFRLDDCEVPRHLRSRQWGDYFGEKKEGTYQTLLRSLQERHQQKLKLEAEERARVEEIARQQAEEATRLEEEKREREDAEKAAREKAELEAARIATKERAESEAAEQARREKEESERKEQETAEKAAREKAKHEKAEYQAARRALFARKLSQIISLLKSIVVQVMPVLRVVGILGIIVALYFGGSWGLKKLNDVNPTAVSSPVPTITETKINTAEPFIYDEFDNPLWEGKFNSELWVTRENCGSISQENNRMVFRNENGGCDLIIRQPREVKGDELGSIEARLMVSSDHKGGFVTQEIDFFAYDLQGNYWDAYCGIYAESASVDILFVIENARANKSPDLYVTVPAKYNQWYVIRLEADPQTMKFSCYVDDKYIGGIVPKDAENLRGAKFERLTEAMRSQNASATSYVDYIKLLP